MGTLYLVRHGQASFGTDNYDRLSELGARQCERLGVYFRQRGIAFDGMISGTLRRQIESLAALQRGLQTQQDTLTLPALNEYDSEAVVQTIETLPMTHAKSPEEVRQYFRLVRQGLVAWIEGRTQPERMPSFAQFAAGIVQALDHVRSTHSGNVLMVSSGGPISTAVAHVMGAPMQTMVELNLRMRNSAVTELSFTPKRHALFTFNTLPHLEGADPSWVTYT